VKFAVVGSGKMAIDVLSCLAELPGAELALAIADVAHETNKSRLSVAATSHGIPCQETTRFDLESERLLADAKPDYIISVNNHLIFRKPHLAAASRGVVNFHNGPLPRYAGLNTCSWALLNGEETYGVTWHLVDEGIDTGGILLQRMFPVEEDATAIELIAQCIEVGIDLFPELARKMLAGNLVTEQQEARGRSFYRKNDRPWSGDFPFWLGQQEMQRLAKALAFWPMPNLFYKPRIKIDGCDEMFAGRYEYEPASDQGISIGKASRSSDGLSVVVQGGLAHLSELIDRHGQPIDLHAVPEQVTLVRPATA
jgi:methionyl-tRNA formyltransferase